MIESKTTSVPDNPTLTANRFTRSIVVRDIATIATPSLRGRKRGNRQRRTFLSLICGLAAFPLLLLGWNILGDRNHPEWWDPPYGIRLNLLRQAINIQPEKPLLLFVGTSRTSNGICSEGFDRFDDCLAFNFGRSGAVPIEQLLALKRLLHDGIRPSQIYLEILPASLCDNRTVEEIIPPARLRSSDLAIVTPYLENSEAYRREWFFHRLNPAGLSRFAILNENASWAMDDPSRWNYQQHSPSHPLGWNTWPSGSPTPPVARRMIELTEKNYRSTLEHLEISDSPRRHIEEFLEVCRSEKIPVALYIMPEAPSFRAWYSPEAENRLQLFLSELQSSYGLLRFDCRMWGNNDDFVDGHHLKAEPARRFTELFMQEQVLPLFKSLPNGQAVASNVE